MGLGEVILDPCLAIISPWEELLHPLGDDQPLQGSCLVQAYDCRSKDCPHRLAWTRTKSYQMGDPQWYM